MTRAGHHHRRVAQETADTRIAVARPEKLLAALGAGRERRRLRRRQLAHEDRELQPVRQHVQRVVESPGSAGRRVGARDVVRLVDALVAGRCFVPCGREHVVGDAHLDVVGLAGEDGQRFVLRLPAEAGDGAVIAAPVRHPADPERARSDAVEAALSE